MTKIDPAKRRRERLIAGAFVLLFVIAAAGAFLYNRRGQEELARQNAYVPKQTTITPEVELLRDYVRIDTQNPPGNELPAAQWLARILAANGVKSEIIESAPRRANLYARIKGRRPNEGLLLLHHMDVWPVNPKQWAHPPFSSEIALNQLHGRGSIDMKGVGICELRAFLDVAKSGRTPERDIVYLAVADEEADSAFGMQWLLEHRPDVIEGIRYSLNEGGITEMLQERVTYFGIEIGTKQTVSVMLAAPTREQLQQVRLALEPWFYQRTPGRVLPEVKKWMREIAPQRLDFRRQLENIDRTIAEGDFWRLPPGYREMTQNILWAENIAHESNEWRMRTLMISLPDEDPDARLSWLRTKVAPFGVRIGEIIRKEGRVPITSDRTPLYQLLAREANRLYGSPAGTEILNRPFNDSRFLRKRGIAAYGIAPFPVDFFQSETIHQPDERVRVDYFQQGVEYMRRVVMTFAFEM